MRTTLARPKSLAEQAAVTIRQRIIDGHLPLGGALSEVALAADLGVSKTPVREALLRLSKDGLVDILPQRGTYVFRLDARQVGELTVMRELLERKALAMAGPAHRALGARLATILAAMERALPDEDPQAYRRLDDGFHQAIIDAADNEFLADAYDRIAFRVQALRSGLARVRERNLKSFADHQRIAALVTAGDMAAADDLLGHHIRYNGAAYVATLGGDDRDNGPRDENPGDQSSLRE